MSTIMIITIAAIWLVLGLVVITCIMCMRAVRPPRCDKSYEETMKAVNMPRQKTVPQMPEVKPPHKVYACEIESDDDSHLAEIFEEYAKERDDDRI